MSTTRKRLCFVLISTGTKLATNVKFKCHLINLLTNVGVARIKVSSKKKQSAKCFIKDIIEPEALQTSLHCRPHPDACPIRLYQTHGKCCCCYHEPPSSS